MTERTALDCDDEWPPEIDAWARATAYDPAAFLAGLNNGGAYPLHNPAYHTLSPAGREVFWKGVAADLDVHRSRSKALYDAKVATTEAARAKAWLRIQKQWDNEGFKPAEFVSEYDTRRPEHSSDKAALLAVQDYLGTPCGDGDDEQRYRNLRERLIRCREYGQQGSPNT